MDVLVCLASRPGQMVERTTIFDEVWGPLHHSDESLTHCIGELRHAFGDQPDNPEYFQTVPKRGYRLVAAVDASAANTDFEKESDQEGGFLARQLGNLRKRKVFQTVIGYPVIAWLLLQIVDVLWEYLLRPLGAPEWIVPAFVVLLAVGYPIAIFAVWAVDLTPEGIEVTVDEGSETPIAGLITLGVGAVFATVLGLVLFFNSYEPEGQIDPPEDPVEVTESPLANSIAVLRFLNLHNLPAIQYLGDGLTEELIHELTNLKTLKVAARTSVWGLSALNMQVPEIAERLNVDKVLEGSVRSDGGDIRVTVQLIDRNGFHLWSEVYESEPLGILQIEKDIARQVVDELGVILSDASETRLDRKPTSDSAAYDNYLRGRERLRQPSTPESLAAAEASFATAIELDSRFSLAYAGACETYLANFRLTRDSQYFEKAEIACHRALTLDGGLAEVYTALGNLYRHFGQNEKAEQEYMTALDINPLMEEATFGLGRTYQAMGLMKKAEEVLTRTVMLEPGYWGSHMGVGNFLHRQGRFAEAVPYYEEVTRLAPDYAGGFINLGSSLYGLGEFDAAEAAWLRSLEISPYAMGFQNMGTLFYYRHRYDDAAEWFERAVESAPTDHRHWGKLAAAQRYIAGKEQASQSSYERAIELARERLAINSDDAEDLSLLAAYLVNTDAPDAAREALERALELAPDDPSTHYFAAIVAIGTGDAAAAIASLQIAVNKGYSTHLISVDPQFESLEEYAAFKSITASSSSGNASAGE